MASSIPESNSFQSAYNILRSSSDAGQLKAAQKVFEQAGVDFAAKTLQLGGHSFKLVEGKESPHVADIAEEALHILSSRAEERDFVEVSLDDTLPVRHESPLSDRTVDGSATQDRSNVSAVSDISTYGEDQVLADADAALEKAATHLVEGLSPKALKNYNTWLESITKALDSCEEEMRSYEGLKGEASQIIQGALFASGRINKTLLLQNLKVHYGIDALAGGAVSATKKDFLSATEGDSLSATKKDSLSATEGDSLSATKKDSFIVYPSFPSDSLDKTSPQDRQKVQNYIETVLKLHKEHPLQKGNLLETVINGLHNICFRFFRLFERLFITLVQGSNKDFKTFKAMIDKLQQAFKSHLAVLKEAPESVELLASIKKTLERGENIIGKLGATTASHLHQDVKQALDDLFKEVNSLKIDQKKEEKHEVLNVWPLYFVNAMNSALHELRLESPHPYDSTLFQTEEGDNIV